MQLVAVKSDMPLFIAHDLLENRVRDLIADAFRQRPVVTFGDNLGDQQDHDLCVQTGKMADQHEDGVAPMTVEQISIERREDVCQQTAMFLLLLNEQVNRGGISGIACAAACFFRW